MTTPHILAIDQGTSSTKAVLVDATGLPVATASHRVTQRHPGPGLVEQSPDDIWTSLLDATAALAGRSFPVAAVALSTQRESVLAWDAATGAALTPVVSRQDRRGAALCAELAADHGEFVARLTGLPLDPMFSATKAAAILDTIDPDRRAARDGAIRVGTLDAWLLRRLTGADRTEIGNASRTQLLDLATGDYSPELLDLFRVPRAALAEPTASTGPFGGVTGLPGVPDGTPGAAVLGDSHAALFAQCAGRPGIVKATYGSGSSLMALAPADAAVPSGLARTLAWRIGDEPAGIALEANIAASGTTVRWAADLLGVDEASLAALAADAGGTDVVLVPAFEGLGAPYWDREARAVLTGFTLDSGRADIARAAIESVAFQVADSLSLFDQVLGAVRELRADGGPAANTALMQFQADLCGRPVAKLRMTVFPKAYLHNTNEPESFAFAGETAGGFDLSRFDPAFFRQLEAAVVELGQRGIQADVILFHPYDRWGFADMGQAADDRYVRYVVRRLSAYANVWWSMANEYDLVESKTEADWERLARLVVDNDPARHLLSIHNASTPYDHSREWITHVSFQGTDPYKSTETIDEGRRAWGKPVIVDECGYEGNLEYSWGNLSGREMVRRFWEGAVRGGYAGHGETYYRDDEQIWWAKGGDLIGESVPRIAFLRRVIEEAPGGILEPLPQAADVPQVGVAGRYYLSYFGYRQPLFRTLTLPPGREYRVDVIDTWNMTVDTLPGTYRGNVRVDLSGREFTALRIVAADDGE